MACTPSPPCLAALAELSERKTKPSSRRGLFASFTDWWNQESPSQDSQASSWYSKDKMLEMRLRDGLRGRLCSLQWVDRLGQSRIGWQEVERAKSQDRLLKQDGWAKPESPCKGTTSPNPPRILTVPQTLSPEPRSRKCHVSLLSQPLGPEDPCLVMKTIKPDQGPLTQ